MTTAPPATAPVDVAAPVDRDRLLDILRDDDASLADVMAAITELEGEVMAPALTVGISANITADLLGVYLRRHALLAGSRAAVTPGAFDSHLDNVARFVRDGVSDLVLLHFFDQLMPAFESRLGDLDPDLVRERRLRLAQELRLALEGARPMKRVFVTHLHRFSAPVHSRHSALIDEVVSQFNATIDEVVRDFPNTMTISAGDALATIGRTQALHPRFYYRATAPYQPRFWDELSRRIMRAARAGDRYLLKVLVLDCDNTLWGGVIGEDLVDGIALGPDTYPGNVYWRVQHQLLALQRRGVLLCLATKNNETDVAEVLERHPHQVIRDQHVIVRKVNWEDKVDNLVAIAQELNLGLDSFVFLDDSSFEIEAVRRRLPMVRAFQVPANVFDYPALVQDISELFLAGRPDEGEVDKTEQYRQLAAGHAEMARHGSREEYLASLGLTIQLRRDAPAAIPRIAALSQKSNQFNLTTRRYTEAEVAALMQAGDAAVYTMGVQDRFGDCGITGIAVVRYAGKVARVEAFLMSCRVLGRGVEQAPWPVIAADAARRGCSVLEAQWLRTARNAQVQHFYDQLGLAPTETSDSARGYRSRLSELVFPPQPHITIHHERD